MKRVWLFGAVFVAGLAAGIGGVTAQSILGSGTAGTGTGITGSADANQNCTSDAYKDKVAASESATSGLYNATNDANYLGKYQMGCPALMTAGYASSCGGGGNFNTVYTGKDGVNSDADFLANHQAQENAFQNYEVSNWKTMQNLGLDKYVGTTLPDGTKVTQSSLLMASQFGVGKVNNYFKSGGVCNGASSDGNGVCVATYMQRGSGYDVSGITGMAADGGSCGADSKGDAKEEKWNGDTTSKTCNPTVPMLQAIPCDKYPGSLQGFCYQYKPLQMDMQACHDAEAWAEQVPPSGPHLETCKTQTFRDGTSSWSYVHACAKAEPAQGKVGDNNSQQKVIGNADDPACYERLKSRGIEFTPLGKVDVSTGGRTCIVPNAVQYKGQAVQFDQTVTLNCALVEEVENFGPTAQSMGITQYKVLSTIQCRGINNTKGLNQAKTTLHGSGNAVDINGFMVNGKLIATSSYFNNATNKAWLTQLRDLGCNNFDGTLAFRFYQGEWTHVHWQATERTHCDPYP